MAEHDTRGGFDLDLRETAALGLREDADLPCRAVDVVAKLTWDGRNSSLDLLARHGEAVRAPVVEALGVLPHGGGAAFLDVQEDLGDDFCYLWVDRDWRPVS